MKNLLLSTLVVLFAPGIMHASGLRVIIDGYSTTFVDVESGAWFAGHTRDAAEAGIVSGYRDTRGSLTGKFGPADAVTIAQALKIAVEGAGYDKDEYRTTTGDHWAKNYVAVAETEGFALFRGTINLDRPATRGEVAKIFTDAFGVDTQTPAGSRFNDVTNSTPYANAIEALSNDGVVSGDTDTLGKAIGTFRPLDEINRAEVVKIIMVARREYNTGPRGRVAANKRENLTNVIRYTDTGFIPGLLSVDVNTVVIFRNESSRLMWVATDPHPVHTILPVFDALNAFEPGQEYSHKFETSGIWGYHNHARSTDLGTIKVR